MDTTTETTRPRDRQGESCKQRRQERHRLHMNNITQGKLDQAFDEVTTLSSMSFEQFLKSGIRLDFSSSNSASFECGIGLSFVVPQPEDDSEFISTPPPENIESERIISRRVPIEENDITNPPNACSSQHNTLDSCPHHEPEGKGLEPPQIPYSVGVEHIPCIVGTEVATTQDMDTPRLKVQGPRVTHLRQDTIMMPLRQDGIVCGSQIGVRMDTRVPKIKHRHENKYSLQIVLSFKEWFNETFYWHILQRTFPHFIDVKGHHAEYPGMINILYVNAQCFDPTVPAIFSPHIDQDMRRLNCLLEKGKYGVTIMTKKRDYLRFEVVY